MKYYRLLLIISLILFQSFTAIAQTNFFCDTRMRSGSIPAAIEMARTKWVGEHKVKRDSITKLYRIIDPSGGIVMDSLQECIAGGGGIYKIQNFRYKWGVINKNAEIMIPVKYDDLRSISYKPGFEWRAENRRKFGIIDSINNVKIPIEYDKVNSMGFQPIIFLEKDDRRELYHIGRNQTVDIKDYCFETVMRGKDLEEHFYIKSNNSIGVMNFDGDVIIEPQYNRISKKRNRTISFYSVTGDNGEGIVSLDGDVIVEPIYNKVICRYRIKKLEEYVFFGKKDTKAFIYYKGTKNEVDFDNIEMKSSLANESLIYKKGDLFGIYNYKDSKIITEPIYQSIRMLSDNYCIVNEEDKMRLLSIKDKKVSLWRFDDLPEYYKVEDKAYWHVTYRRKVGLIDENLDYVLEPQFDRLYNFRLGVGCFSIKGKYGMINKDLKYQLEPIYDQLGTTGGRDQKIFMKHNGKCNYINKLGEIVGDCNL